MKVSLRWRRLLSILVACSVVLMFAAPAFADTPIVHVVQPGENLYRISLRYGVSMPELAAANGIANVNCLYAGQRLVIIGSSWMGWGPPTSARPDCYRVQHGDTLARIAARFGTTVWHLASLNGIADPNRIWAGQVLSISEASCGHGYPQPLPPAAPCPPPCGPPIIVPPPCSTCQPPYPCGSCCGTDCWQGEFFGNTELTGTPILQRWDRDLKFNWGSGSPDIRMPSDNFSARWTRSQMLSEGRYRVTVRADDGVRVSINSVGVIDEWRVQGGTTFTQDVVLRSSSVRTIVVEYFDGGGAAEISFAIERIS